MTWYTYKLHSTFLCVTFNLCLIPLTLACHQWDSPIFWRNSMVEPHRRKENQSQTRVYALHTHEQCYSYKSEYKCHTLCNVIMKILTNEASNCVLTQDRKMLDREGRTFLLNSRLPASLWCQGPCSIFQTDFSVGVDPSWMYSKWLGLMDISDSAPYFYSPTKYPNVRSKNDWYRLHSIMAKLINVFL